MLQTEDRRVPKEDIEWIMRKMGLHLHSQQKYHYKIGITHNTK